MNRNDLRELARIRIKEAKALLDNGLYDGAYYLCGYSVECALKACIAKRTQRFDFPEKKKVLESYSHKLVELVNTAGLKELLAQEITNNKFFGLNWQEINDWSENSRYTKNSAAKAQKIYKAVTSRRNGVLQWIKGHW